MDDDDDDLVTDWADSYNWDGSQTAADNLNLNEGDFSPLVVEILGPIQRGQNAPIAFQYNGSNPSQISGPPAYTPALGAIRIWRKDGHLRRSIGDYMHPGIAYLIRDLPFTDIKCTFWVEGIAPGKTGIMAEIVVDDAGGHILRGQTHVTVTLDDRVAIKGLTIPNEFVALPDQITSSRIQSSMSQQAVTDVEVTYSVNLPTSPDAVEFELSGGIHVFRQALPTTAGPDIVQLVRIALNDEWMTDEDVQLAAVLRVTSDGESYVSRRIIPGKRLLYNVEFSPKAYGVGTPVCPYTHKQSPVYGTDLKNEWYGLWLTYDIPGAVVLDSLLVDITGGDVGEGGKRLMVMEDAKLGSDYEGANHQVKWEGYDATINEPASLPYCVFPEAVTKRPAPMHVVAEGDYQYRIKAVGTKHRDGKPDLEQWHLMDGIPIHVRYNMTDAVLGH